MLRSRRALSWRTLGLLFGASLLTAAAQTLSFSPLRLFLQGNQRATSLNLTNGSQQAVTYAIDLVSWTQNGSDVYAPTRDLVVNPTRFTLQPGQQQTIRVALRGAPPNGERTYRVYVRELPPVATPGAPALKVQTLFRIGLPLFVLPTPGEARVGITVETGEKGAELVVRNEGSRYVLVKDFKYTLGGRTADPDTFNILAGGVLRFPLPAVGDATGVDISYRLGDAGEEQRATVPVKR